MCPSNFKLHRYNVVSWFIRASDVGSERLKTIDGTIAACVWGGGGKGGCRDESRVTRHASPLPCQRRCPAPTARRSAPGRPRCRCRTPERPPPSRAWVYRPTRAHRLFTPPPSLHSVLVHKTPRAHSLFTHTDTRMSLDLRVKTRGNFARFALA